MIVTEGREEEEEEQSVLFPYTVFNFLCLNKGETHLTKKKDELGKSKGGLMETDDVYFNHFFPSHHIDAL